MRTETKAIFDNMIQLVNNRDFESKLFLKAEKKLSKPIVYMLIRDLIFWNNNIFLKLNQLNPEKWLLETEEFGKKYEEHLAVLLENCPELEILFEIVNHCLVFKSAISNAEIKEIRAYVETNQKIALQSKETRKRK